MPTSLNFSQFDFVEPSSGFHHVTWERVIYNEELKQQKQPIGGAYSRMMIYQIKEVVEEEEND